MTVNEQKTMLIAADEMPASCWNELENRYQLYFARDGYQVFQMLTERHFDIIFLDISLFGYDGRYLLRHIQENHLCGNVVLTSEIPNFSYAREGILYGASDYILRPFEIEPLCAVLERLEAHRSSAEEEHMLRVMQSIRDVLGTPQFEKRLQQGLNEMERCAADSFQLAHSCREMYQSIVLHAFQKYRWLPLYLSRKDCDTACRWDTSDPKSIREDCQAQSIRLHQLLTRLHPELNSPKMEPILEYMLSHVDEALSQKELAAKFFISSSTLSTYFSNTSLRSYRQYNQELHMTRAEFLLRNTDMKLYEICEQLGFRDVNYFSQLFKRRTGVSVTDYRSANLGNCES